MSSDQSPITTNRTNVTLYGVQPGETYTVEIITSFPIHTYKMSITGQKLMLLTTTVHNSITTVPVDLSNQMNSNNNVTVKTTSTPAWVAPMIALPWLLLLIGILSVLVYIVIIKGMLIIGTGHNGILNLFLSLYS